MAPDWKGGCRLLGFIEMGLLHEKEQAVFLVSARASN